MYKKSKLEDFFGNSRLALSNAKDNPQVRPLLSTFNVDDARFEEGFALLDEADASETLKKEKYAAQFETKLNLQRLSDETHEVHMMHVKLIRIAYRKQPEKLKELGVLGATIRKSNINGWLLQTKYFYDHALVDDVLETLARYSITREKMEETKQNVLKVEKANEVYKQAIAEAQDAVDKRDLALQKFEYWMSEFIAVCRYALKGNPQLLEALQIKVFSKGYQRKKKDKPGDSDNQPVDPKTEPQDGETGKDTGTEECINKGKSEGEKNKALEIAEKALKEEMPIELISKLTGLTKEEIEKLN